MQQENQARKKSYRLHLTNLLFQDGHVRKMGGDLGIWMALTDKTTEKKKIIHKGQERIAYPVYDGLFSRTIISELIKDTGKSEKTVWRGLDRLNRKDYLTYEKSQGRGTKIILFEIKGAFERSFHSTRESSNSVRESGKSVRESGNSVQESSKSDTLSELKNEESVKKNKENLENAQKVKSPVNNNINNNINNNNSRKTVAAAICQIFQGQVKSEKVKDAIKGKDLGQMVELAHYCQEDSSAKNPPGLFFAMVKEGTRPPRPAKGRKSHIHITTRRRISVRKRVAGNHA